MKLIVLKNLNCTALTILRMTNNKSNNRKQKRGRKPRGGKIIDAPSETDQLDDAAPPVILHLRCRLSDLDGEPSTACQSPQPFQDNQGFELISTSVDIKTGSQVLTIDQKITNTAEALEMDTLNDQSSACFWCTCPFGSRPVYIPCTKATTGTKGYGCFCSPECAVAHLFADKSIDKSTIYERYSLINNLYVSNSMETKPIKAAPDPHYLLDKFYGNLTIEEYRELSKSDRVVLVVKAPLTRSLPQLHVHSSTLTSAGEGSRKYRLSRSERPRSKTQRMQQAFGV